MNWGEDYRRFETETGSAAEVQLKRELQVINQFFRKPVAAVLYSSRSVKEWFAQLYFISPRICILERVNWRF